MIVQICLILLLLFSTDVFAQQEDTKQAESHNSPTSQHSAHYHPNHVAIFAGGTTELEKDKDTHFTLGIDYVRRFTESGRVGIGVFGEVIFAEHTEYLVGIPLYIYPTNHFWLRAGPGLEIYEDEKEKKSNSTAASTSITSGDSYKETNVDFFIRAGLGYDFEVTGFTIGPNASFDFFREKITFIWGIALGKGF